MNITNTLTNPFVGLRAFEENEDYLFFGRATQTNELLRKLGDGRFLAIIGSSGSGKSSLVKSGLLPAIYGGFMKAGSNWRVALIKPGENPIGYLTRALAKNNLLFSREENNDIPYEAIIESSLRRSENGLSQVYKDAHLPPDENLLIVVDQFEELFRFSKYEKENKLGQSDAMHFIHVLLTAAQQKECPIYVLLTMRSDFLGDCAEFRGLPEAINNGQYLVPRMSRNEIRQAITGPVAVSGATISQRLVTRLLNDINNDMDQLPVLQHAMMRTWDAWHKRNQPASPIDFEDYEKIGTMKSALSQHADEAYAELVTKKEQQVCELMFKALTDKSADVRGIRRPRTIVDLCLLAGASQTEMKKMVETFRKPGRTFLMPPVGTPLTDDTIVDISHESLMRIWTRLVSWTEEEARSGDLYLRLANSAQLQQQGLRGLLKDPELKLALQWKDKNQPTAKWAEGFKGDFNQAINYLEESRTADLEEKKIVAQKEASRKRLVRIIMGLLGVLVIIGFVVASILNQQKNEAEQARRDAEKARNAAQKSDRETKAALINVRYSDSVARHERDNAIVAQQTADSNATVAEQEKEKATENALLARIATDTAEAAKTKAERLKEEAKNQAYKNAPSEYARLIREGPSDKKGIIADAFDYKLVAYTTHLENLGDLISETKDPEAMAKYNGLLKRLYFNNDLYEKIYACIANTSNDKSILFGIANDQSSITNGDMDLKNANFERVNKEMSTAGKRVLKIVQNGNDKKLVCSTDDNLIYVFGYGKSAVKLETIIPMGARVTALDYTGNKNIIYFGLENGNIGFIRYDKDKRNQPVFENALGTPITAIQLFTTKVKNEEINFLLAAGKKSKVVVYELDENSLLPDKRLLGNSLPEKNLGEVTNAEFNEKTKLVMIRVQSSKNASQSTYQWNPFTALALDEYKKKRSDPKYLSLTQLY
jgi:energy-coupling factor transporter ATP-binding protein EcfA2/flagellar basal body-associated protein FliL